MTEQMKADSTESRLSVFYTVLSSNKRTKENPPMNGTNRTTPNDNEEASIGKQTNRQTNKQTNGKPRDKQMQTKPHTQTPKHDKRVKTQKPTEVRHNKAPEVDWVWHLVALLVQKPQILIFKSRSPLK